MQTLSQHLTDPPRTHPLPLPAREGCRYFHQQNTLFPSIQGGARGGSVRGLGWVCYIVFGPTLPPIGRKAFVQRDFGGVGVGLTLHQALHQTLHQRIINF